MKVENYPIESVIPYARNPRKNDEAATKVAASIKEFGWQQPIVVDSEMVIIAGHTRLLAAQRLGLDEVPVAIAADLSPEQVKAYRLADNRVSEESSWDSDLLPIELDELKGFGFDLKLLGFDDKELVSILSNDLDSAEDVLNEESYSEVFNIIITCKDEKDQEQVFVKLNSEGYKCQVQSL